MILSQIERWAAVQPNALALTSGDCGLTYSGLRDAILSAQERVEDFDASAGLALLDLNDMVVAWPWLLALRSLGYTVLPTSPAAAVRLLLPPRCMTLVLSTSTVDASIRSALPLANDARVIEGHDFSAVLKTIIHGRRRSLGDATGGSLLLSSGTTGRPKVVLFKTENEDQTISATSEAMFDTRSVWCGGFTLTTAAGYKAPLRVWAAGGEVILNQESDPAAPFETDRLTRATVTPGMLSQILADERRGRFNPGLKIAIVGGVAHWPDVVRARERLAPYIAALYASTEAGGLAWTELVVPEDLRLYNLDPKRTVQIVDEDNVPVAPGEVGIVRADLAAGIFEYWNDPEASARIFKDGFFYPGDMGRIIEDGRLELVGRTDDVLVWQGDKIAPGPLEREIKDRTGVSEACLFVERTTTGERLLVVLEGGGPAIGDTLRQVASDIGGRGQVRVVAVAAMPRNAMGKVQRQILKNAVADATKT